MKIYIALVLCLGLYSQSAMAFVEAYSFFSAKESDELNGPQRVDGEYYSDLLAYRQSLETDYKFLKSDSAYDIFVGSISSKRFAIQQRLKLKQNITEKLIFDLIYIEKENFEEAREQFVSGLTYQILQSVGVSAYTSLYSDKSRNDLGLSLNFNPTQNHQIKIFANRVDFGFNERNEINAQDRKDPLHFGFIGTWADENLQFFQYALFHNAPVTRDFLDLDQRYVFEETRLRVSGRKKLNSNRFINLDIEAFKGKEGRFSTVAFDATEDFNWDRTGARILGQFEDLKTIFGVEYNYRYWSAEQGQVQHSNIMPHVWYKMAFAQSYLALPQRIDFGLEASFHQAQGQVNLRSSTDADSDLNSRLNLRFHYQFSSKAFLNLLMSADLDDGFSWEGGAGQFQILL